MASNLNRAIAEMEAVRDRILALRDALRLPAADSTNVLSMRPHWSNGLDEAANVIDARIAALRAEQEPKP